MAAVRRGPLLLFLGIILLALAWWNAPDLVSLLIFDEPAPPRETPAQAADVEGLQQAVTAALPALGVRGDQLIETSSSAQEDRSGGWSAVEERWQLPSDAVPLALARRLESLVAAEDPGNGHSESPQSFNVDGTDEAGTDNGGF